jgi:hypothetical protein
MKFGVSATQSELYFGSVKALVVSLEYRGFARLVALILSA